VTPGGVSGQQGLPEGGQRVRRAGEVVASRQIRARMLPFRLLGADGLGSATQRAQIVD
jgi:hypothetical protein